MSMHLSQQSCSFEKQIFVAIPLFSIFIHTSTPLFQQLKCCIALVFARMHLLKNLMGRKFQKKLNLNEGWFVIRGSMVIVTVMCKVSNMVTVRYKVSVTVMYLVT